MPSISTVTNGAQFAVDSALKSSRAMTGNIARLSSGIRTKYGNDPAGASVADSLNNQARSADMAARNAEAGISFLKTAESILFELANLNTRLRELAVQKASTGTLSDADVAAITAEENAIVIAADEINDEQLNGVDLISEVRVAINFEGSFAHIGSPTKPTLASGVANCDTQMGNIQNALGHVAAGINALKGHQSGMYALSANTYAAASRIESVDFAKEAAELAKNKIINQSSLAMVSQANQAQMAILGLLD